jgi:hypothetical protein
MRIVANYKNISWEDRLILFMKSYHLTRLTKKQRNKIYECLLLHLDLTVYSQGYISCLDFLESFVTFIINPPSIEDVFPLSQLEELMLFHPVWCPTEQYKKYPTRNSSWFVEQDESDKYHHYHKRTILEFCYIMTL